MPLSNVTSDAPTSAMTEAARQMGRKSWQKRLERCGGIEGVRAEVRQWAANRRNKAKDDSGTADEKQTT